MMTNPSHAIDDPSKSAVVSAFVLAQAAEYGRRLELYGEVGATKGGTMGLIPKSAIARRLFKDAERQVRLFGKLARIEEVLLSLPWMAGSGNAISSSGSAERIGDPRRRQAGISFAKWADI
ncbi:MAG: hypothetical protein ACHQ9S_17885 [Candidatus Binatia bacterium]